VGSRRIRWWLALAALGAALPAHAASREDVQARAKAVLDYLVQKYPTLDATHFSVKGYGPTVPIAPNKSALGRAKNRRVEFKVTNTEALKIEREKRHFVQKSEPAPITPPAPKPAAPDTSAHK